MKRIIQPYFTLIRMINVTIENFTIITENPQQKEILNWKRNLLTLTVLFFTSFLFAQAPTVNYTGVQSNYPINVPIPTLTPTISGGLHQTRTNVSTLAGNGTSGYIDGTTASPKYYSPTGIAIAPSGNMYVADSQNHCIRKITSSGIVSTLAGAGLPGFANGTANQAQFNIPYAVAVDASENVYVIESTSNAIRKITAAGVVSTFAGDITNAGYLDGQGTSALFSSPKGLDVDASGNVYVADSGNNRIRKISTTGTVTTFAGSGAAGYVDAQGVSAKFNNPTSVAVTNSGALYVSDTSNNRIRAISTSGLVTTFAGSGASGMVNGQGTSAQFNTPRALAVDASGTVCVVDYSNNRLRKITNTGLVSTLSGTGAFGAVNGVGTSATFKYPEGIALDASGNAFVADVTNNCIRKITTSGDTSTFSGSAIRGLENGQGGTMALLNGPVAVAVTSSGITYVIDDFNSCIRKITPNGIVTTFAGNSTTGFADGAGSVAYFNNPKGIAVDAAGTIYVADTFNNRIRKITSSGVVTTIAGDGTAGYLDGQGTSAKFNNPYGLTVDAAGNIFVADTKNHRIRKISTSGTVTTIAGYILSGFADGASTVARFKNPQGIAIDNATGILYVADTTNNRIRKIATDGSVSTFAGSFAGYTDDLGTAAYFNTPIGIAIDASKNLYVGDYYNSVVRKVDPTGLVSTYAGNGSSEFMDGIGNVASFYFPVGVAADASGNVFVADSYTQRIRKITSVEPFTIIPALPAGINFNTSTGVLSGTPTEIKASTTYTITASNYSGTGTTTITFAIGTGSGPSAPTANAQSFCNSATVSNLVATGTALKWYTVASGGTALNATTALSTGNYYVSQTVSSIESSRTSVSVTINNTVAPTASAQTFSNSATVANLVATGSSLQWYLVSSGGSVLNSTTTLSNGNYYVSQTLNGCESSRTLVSVTINVAPGAPTANAQSFCNGATVSNLVATGTALKWYNVASGGSVLNASTTLSTGNYYVSQTVSSIESSRTAVLVTINTTAAPTASAQSFCISATVSNLVATGISLKWYSFASGGTVLNSTTALSNGTYYVSQTLNSCESTRTSVSVTINNTVAPTASAQTFSNSATVADLVANGSSLQWYTASNGGTALNSTTQLSNGNYYVSQTLNGCESSRTLVSVTVNVAPGAPTANSQSFCNGATVSNLVATGTALKWYNVASGGSVLNASTTLSTGNYYVSQTVSSIESSRTAVLVTINTTAAPTASAQSFCTSATVANLVATGTSLKWYSFSSGGSVLNLTTALSNGTYYVSQTLNSCESSRSSVSVTINNIVAPTASAQTFSNSATVADLVANGSSLQWYTTSNGGNALGTSTALSTGNYYVSQTLNGCESSRTLVSVTINVAPGAPTANAQSFCNGATVSNLVATGTALKWYNVASGGSVLNASTTLSTGNYYVSQTVNSVESSRTAVLVTINTTAAPTASAQSFCTSATVSNLVATGTSLKWYSFSSGGSVLNSTTALSNGTYYVSQTLNSCESSRSSVSVVINNTVAPTASAQTFSNSATVADLVANGSSLQWYTASNGGTALASSTTLSNGNYYVSQTQNGCESSRTLVSVTINVAPGAPTASAQSFCSGASVSNLVANGTSLKWYTLAIGGTVLSSNTILTTRNYYVSQTVNSVESSRTLVAVIVNNTPTPSATSQAFCSGATVADLVATGTDINWYTVGSGGSALVSTTALVGGILYVSQTVNGCESSRIIIGVTVNTTAAPTASSQSFTNSATVGNLVASGTALKWYDVASGGSPLASNVAIASGTYYVSQTINGCESPRTVVLVTINSITPAPTASAQSFCNSATVANLVATGTLIKWYTAVVGGTPLASTMALSTGNYYVSQTINSIESSRTIVAVTVTITSAPTASAQFFCNAARVSNLTANGTSLKWYTSINGGTALIAATGLVTGNFYVSQTVNGCESTRTQVPVTVSIASVATAVAQSFCIGATVSNLTANGTSLKWYSTLTGGTELVSSTVLASGNYYVSQTINTCESTRTLVLVTVNTVLAPTAFAQSFTNSASISNLVATGTNLQWYNVPSGGTALSSATALSSGTYYVSQTVNGCESSRTSVYVVINLATTAPIASAQTFCNGATVSDLVAIGSSLKWYTVASGGNTLTSNTVLVTGNYYVSQTVNLVESPRTTVSVIVNVTNAPTAFAQTFNTSANVSNLVATGTNLQWYTVASGGTALSSATALSSGTYYVSQTVNGCESTRTVVPVTINTVSGAPLASAQSFCTGATIANLVATGTALKWYLVATGGTVLAPNTVLTTRNYYVSQTVNGAESQRTMVGVTISTTPSPTVLSQTFCSGATVSDLVATGTSIKWYTSNTSTTSLSEATLLTSGIYYVSQTQNGCESSRMIVALTVNTTAVPTTSAQTFNYAATISNLVASGTSLKWYTSVSGGNALAPSVALLSGTYYVTQTVNGCESTRRAVSVTMSIEVGVPTAFAQSFCNASTVSDLQANGTSLKWYTVAVGGTALPFSNVITSGNYYVSQTINNVESARRLVSVNVYGLPISQTISSPTYSGSRRSTICTSDTKVINVKSGYLAGKIEWEVAVMPLNSTIQPLASAYSKIEGATGASYSVTNAKPGRNYFRAKFINGDCEETAKYSNDLVVFYSGCGSSTRLSAVTYPNPFTENFKLSVSTSSIEKVQVFIYDLTGRLVEQREINLDNISEIELGDQYPSGVFIVNVTQGDNVKTLKVVKR